VSKALKLLPIQPDVRAVRAAPNARCATDRCVARRARRARRVLAALLAGALAAAPLPAFAAPPAASASASAKPGAKDPPNDRAKLEEARTHRDKGLKLFKDGAYEAALVEFERAFELAPTWRLHYNIALIHRQMNDFAGALDRFERFLSEGGAEVPADRKKEVDKEIAALRAKVGALRVVVEGAPAGASVEIAIDDVPIGKAPLAKPVVVNPGKRRVTATPEGLAPVTKLATVAAGETIDVSIALPPPPAPLGTPTPKRDAPADAPPRASLSSNGPWIGLGVAGGLAIFGTVTGVLALRASSKLSDLRDGAPSSRADLDAQARTVRTWSITTDVLLLGAAATASVSLYFLLKSPASNDAPSKGPRVGIGPGSVVVMGEF
jgi:hypothetical protein